MELLKIINGAIHQILSEDGYINIVINNDIRKYQLKDNDKALFTKITYGVIENKIYLDYQLKIYLNDHKLPINITNYLRIATYTILFMNISNAYIVNQIIDLIKEEDFKYVKLANAVLRNIDRNKAQEIKVDNEDLLLSIKYSYPINLVTYIKKMYPNDYPKIFKHPEDVYNTYRINALLPSNIINYLDEHHVDYDLIDNMIVTKTNLNNTIYVKKGHIINQNLSSAKVVNHLDIKTHQKVLDMCSAPGTKAIQLLGKNRNIDLTCIDLYPHKTKLINDALALNNIQNVKVLTGDATTYPFSETYDVIMLDAPCSGLGVMKHKVDLKYKFSFKETENIITLQKALLGKAYKLLNNQGTLIYSTCTINKLENEEMINYFLKKHKDMKLVYQESILPDGLYDGFFIVEMVKDDGKHL